MRGRILRYDVILKIVSRSCYSNFFHQLAHSNNEQSTFVFSFPNNVLAAGKTRFKYRKYVRSRRTLIGCRFAGRNGNTATPDYISIKRGSVKLYNTWDLTLIRAYRRYILVINLIRDSLTAALRDGYWH